MEQVQLLDLSLNKIGDQGLFSLVPVLHQINNLCLSNCDITFAGIQGLAEKLIETQNEVSFALNAYFLYEIYGT